MGKSAVLVRLIAACAVTAVAGGVVLAPASAQTPAAPSLSAASPNTPVATPAPVSGAGVTPRAARKTGLKIRIVGVTAGGRATVKVTGPKQSKGKKAKKYSKVIHRSKTLRVRPGIYKVTSRTVAATGGTDVPAVATKKLRVRKNKLTGFTVRYTLVTTCSGLAVGGTGPGGGKVFYKDMTRTPGSQCMEAATSATSPVWTTPDPSLRWGTVACANSDISGATGTVIGTGVANTNAITSACNAGQAPAAWAAKNYTGGGVSWFLPSKDELNALYTQRAIVGGFAAAFYWSSSQGSAAGAWIQSFNNGNPAAGSKNFPNLVRPVRAF